VYDSSTTTTLTSSLNASHNSQQVTLTATVHFSGSPTFLATSYVEFLDDGNYIGAGYLDEGGVATLTTNALSEGSHTITAEYQGDGVFDSSLSDPLAHTVVA